MVTGIAFASLIGIPTLPATSIFYVRRRQSRDQGALHDSVADGIRSGCAAPGTYGPDHPIRYATFAPPPRALRLGPARSAPASSEERRVPSVRAQMRPVAPRPR